MRLNFDVIPTIEISIYPARTPPDDLIDLFQVEMVSSWINEKMIYLLRILPHLLLRYDSEL